jgi:hypothetical protein
MLISRGCTSYTKHWCRSVITLITPAGKFTHTPTYKKRVVIPAGQQVIKITIIIKSAGDVYYYMILYTLGRRHGSVNIFIISLASSGHCSGASENASCARLLLRAGHSLQCNRVL